LKTERFEFNVSILEGSKTVEKRFEIDIPIIDSNADLQRVIQELGLPYERIQAGLKTSYWKVQGQDLIKSAIADKVDVSANEIGAAKKKGGPASGGLSDRLKAKK